MVAELDAARDKLHKAIDMAFYMAADLVHHGEASKAASVAHWMRVITDSPPYVVNNWTYLARNRLAGC